MRATNKRTARFGIGLIALAICVATGALTGCVRKERVVDVQTPVGDVKVDREVGTGNVEVKTNTK